MNFRETEEFRKGRGGEQTVMDLLQKAGWHVIPSYDYCGADEKAPRMQGAKGFFVIPDLDASRNGRRIWAEVKTKASANYTRVTDRLEHGIPRRHYEDYLRVQRESGTAVYLVICEEDTGEVLIATLDELARDVRFYTGGKMSRGGMAFFPRSAFNLCSQQAARQEQGDAA